MREVENIKYLFDQKDTIMEQKRIAEFKYDPYDYIRGCGLLERCKQLGDRIQRRSSTEIINTEAGQYRSETIRTNRELQPNVETNVEHN
jgi:hypothetical protein